MPSIAFRITIGRGLFFLLFALSGFSGLIYESVWSHYLKLFLGHAAYAQTLVLAIFMGGMALGAWLVSRYTGRLRNLLLGYALVEGIIGVLALIFHETFIAYQNLAFNSVIPALGSPGMVDLFKWSSAALMILPQSMLLGMTFPLMSGGIIRRYPDTQGGSLAMLYFTNSIGAAMGALVSGFLLIGWIGLPGTMRTAGVINIVLALIVLVLARGGEARPEPETEEHKGDPVIRLFLIGAFITGTASFIYEIAWIRMLSLVLGSSFHAFELMLSAFITGLALGGLWIKKRIDKIENPVRFSGYVQVIMGLLALMTLVLYNQTFDWMSYFLEALDQTEAGYTLFNLASHLIAFAIMLPATFMAGMTLPLFTHVLIRKGQGEKSIGRIYASNTVGAIVGILFAVHIGMVALGLKLLIICGVLLDIGLGITLLRYSLHSKQRVDAMATLAISAAILALAMNFARFDLNRLSSGVYRTGDASIPTDEYKVFFYRDGKTASVSVIGSKRTGIVTIATNGKPDASITMAKGGEATTDEITMAMAAAIPLSFKTDAKTVANIGFGSGMTTHTLLANPELQTVDTIEIEPAMIEGARAFLPNVKNAFEDARSHFYTEDAKTFFAKHQSKYDLIISEPSNPWVSGVSSLFSEEFYAQAKRHLTDDGLLVQWIQLYEIDLDLISPIMGAIDQYFDDYAVYNTDDSNMLIVAKPKGSLGSISKQVFSRLPNLVHELHRQHIIGVQDLEIRRIGSKELLQPFFNTFSNRTNSDYYPIVELNAPKTRYLGAGGAKLTTLTIAPIPVLEMLDTKRRTWNETNQPTSKRHIRSLAVAQATLLRKALMGSTDSLTASLSMQARQQLQLFTAMSSTCIIKDQSVWLNSLHWLANTTLAFLSPEELREIWVTPNWLSCADKLSQTSKDRMELYKAIAERNAEAMAKQGEHLLQTDSPLDTLEWKRFLLGTAMLGNIVMDDKETSRLLWKAYAQKLFPENDYPSYFLLMLQHSKTSNDD